MIPHVRASVLLDKLDGQAVTFIQLQVVRQPGGRLASAGVAHAVGICRSRAALS